MRALTLAGCCLTFTGLLVLQGCGSKGSHGAANVGSSSSSSSSTSSSSASSSSGAISAAETYLRAANLSPDSGIAAANTLAAEDFPPENPQASVSLDAEDWPSL